MYLVARVSCNDEWAVNTPDIFVLELSVELLAEFAKMVSGVNDLKANFETLYSAEFSIFIGKWMASETLAEELEEDEMIVLGELPDDCEGIERVVGDTVHIWPKSEYAP